MTGPGLGKHRPTRSDGASSSQISISTRSYKGGESSNSALPNISTSADNISTLEGHASNIVKRKRGPTRNVALAKKKQAGHKLLIEISEDDNRVVGLDSKSFITEGGCVVRRQASLEATKWAKITNEERDIMRRMASGSFEIQGNGDALKIIDAQLNRQYRNYRSKLHREHFEIHPNLDEALQHPPRGVTTENWDYICHYFATPEFKKVSDRNKANRAKQNTPHITGTKSFARLRQEEKAATGKELGQIMLYEKTRFSDKKNAWVNNDAKQKHEQMEMLKKNAQVEGSDPMTEEEICLQVLGHKSGYVRGRGAGPKPTSSSYKVQLEEYKRRAEQAEQENSEIKQQNNEIKQQNTCIQQQNSEMQLEMQQMKASQKRTDEMLRALMEQMQNGGQRIAYSSW